MDLFIRVYTHHEVDGWKGQLGLPQLQGMPENRLNDQLENLRMYYEPKVEEIVDTWTNFQFSPGENEVWVFYTPSA